MAALAAKLLPEAKCRPLRQVGAARLTTLVPAKPKADPVRFAAQEQELAAKLAQAQAAHAPADEVKALQRQLDTVKAEATVLPHFERLPRCAGTEIEIEASALRLNDTLVVGLGGEPFAQLGLDVKAGLPGFHTLVAAYCNDYVGYVPTRRGYQEGGYEAVTNRLAPGAGEAMAALGVRAGKACTGKPER
jgi:hypothetical protein